MGFLIVVLLVAATSPLWVAVTTSFAAVLAFNFFFLPPIGTLTIEDPQNWLALFSLLVVILVARKLSAVGRTRTPAETARRDVLRRLSDLSRDVLLITEQRDAQASIAGYIADRFDLDSVAICLPEGAQWTTSIAGRTRMTVDAIELSAVFHRAADDQEPGAPSERRLMPLRLGDKTIGVLVAAGRPIERHTLEAVAGVAALAIERAWFLDDRKAADLARQ